jgi:hypothetical protein
MNSAASAYFNRDTEILTGEPLAKALKNSEGRHSGQAERDPESSFLRHPGFPPWRE